MAFGSPGGDCQDQWGLLFFLYTVAHEMDLQQAIDSPLLHTTHLVSSFDPRTFEPRTFHVEGRLPGAVIEKLEEKNHRVVLTAEWSQGYLCAAGVDPSTGLLMAASNPRDGQGYAAGR